MNPVITFALIAYNQERFIREAFESALRQTYQPLELIVIDDCSTDRTFDIIEEMASKYRGTHTVRAIRNACNLGIGGNVSRAVELCRGELIVLGAGDDVSVPDRTEVLHQTWESSGRQAMSLFSSHMRIDAEGREYGISGTRGDPNDRRMSWELNGDLLSFLSSRQPMVNGCSAAWSPELLRYFGNVRTDLEDVVLSFRALAIGQMHYINRPLVRWRRHGDNVSFLKGEVIRSFDQRERQLRRVNEMTMSAFDNIIDDIEVLWSRGRVSENDRRTLQTEARRVREFYSVEINMMSGGLLHRVSTVLGTAAAETCVAPSKPRLGYCRVRSTGPSTCSEQD